MNVSVLCKEPTGEVTVIPSKSVAHRVIISAALSDEPTEIVCKASSRDIEATLDCVAALGATVERRGGSIFITPEKGEGKAVLDCAECGSTLRFLIPVAATLPREIELCGRGRLASRPIAPLLECLSANGAEFSYDGALPLTMRGGLNSGTFRIAGDISSQFISGLIFALPTLDGDSVVEIVGKLESSKYIDMTVDAVSRFGIKVERNGNLIKIRGNQKYISPSRVEVEGDWSNAAFWASLGAFSEKGIVCHGVDNGSLQGDRELLGILQKFGAEVETGKDFFTVRKKELRAVSIDAAEIPDLVPVLSVIASVSEGETKIYNASRLRIKESDRIETTVAMINALGGNARAEDDCIFIRGRQTLPGGTVNAENDHRIAMSAAIAAVVCDGAVKIVGAEAVEKSYGNFFEEYEKLGAKTKISEE